MRRSLQGLTRASAALSEGCVLLVEVVDGLDPIMDGGLAFHLENEPLELLDLVLRRADADGASLPPGCCAAAALAAARRGRPHASHASLRASATGRTPRSGCLLSRAGTTGNSPDRGTPRALRSGLPRPQGRRGPAGRACRGEILSRRAASAIIPLDAFNASASSPTTGARRGHARACERRMRRPLPREG